MKIYATPLSHFARKVRLLLDLYNVAYEFVDVGNVALAQAELFLNNPMMKVPVLVDAKNWLIESDHMASYVVNKLDAYDKYEVKTQNIFDLNARAVMNGIMQEEVKYILARRTGIEVEKYAFFDKAYKSITQGLEWLEQNAEHFTPDSFKYRELHLLSLWEHIEYYELVKLDYPKLLQVIKALNLNPIIQKTSPRILKPK